MINEVEHLFLWLLPKWMFYCETFVYIFSHLFSVVLYCILLICRSSLYIPAVNLCWVYVANIFSSLVDCLFACLMESFYKTTKTLLGLLETFCLDFSFLPAVAPEIGNYCEKKTSNMPAAPYIFTKSLVFFPSSVPQLHPFLDTKLRFSSLCPFTKLANAPRVKVTAESF